VALWFNGEDKVQTLAVMADAAAEMRLAAQETPRIWFEALRVMELHVAALWDAGHRQDAMLMMREVESIERAREAFKDSGEPVPLDSREDRFEADRIGALWPGMPAELKVKLLEQIVFDQPAASSSLATALEGLCGAYIRVKELQAALEAITKAVEIRRKLADSTPSRDGRKLADDLWVKIAILEALGRKRESEAVAREFSTTLNVLRKAGVEFDGDYEPDDYDWMRNSGSTIPGIDP
jgi:hypothetical protein